MDYGYNEKKNSKVFGIKEREIKSNSAEKAQYWELEDVGFSHSDDSY